jgi:hypothetical protein
MDWAGILAVPSVVGGAGGGGVAVPGGEPGALERVSSQPATERLEGQDVLGRDVSEVDVGPEPEDQIPLLGPERSLPEDPARIAHTLQEGLDLGLAGQPRGVVDPHALAGLPRLHDDHERAAVEVGVDGPGERRHRLGVGRVLLAHLRQHAEPGLHGSRDRVGPGPGVHLDRAVRDLDRVEPELAGPVEVAVQRALPDRDLLEGPARHAVDAVGRDRPHLLLEDVVSEER